MTHFESHIKEYLEQIKDICIKIEKRGGKFNPWQFVQKWSDKKAHPRAIMSALKGILFGGDLIKTPWAYGNKIIKIKSGNYYEHENTEESKKYSDISEALKNNPLKDLVKDMFGSI